jgi:hypothetical protein
MHPIRPDDLANNVQAYARPEINRLYNLLFCDAPELFRPRSGATPSDWQAILFAEHPDAEQVRALAEDPHAEGRVRALAHNWLRTNGHAASQRELLGVVVEVPLEDGLDTLAAYADGRVRYINHTGAASIFEDAPPEIAAKVRELLAASQVVVNQIGPWDGPRRPPPARGNIRLTFIVSDGLYFGEGAFPVMAQDSLAGPVIQRATELLQLVVSVNAQ